MTTFLFSADAGKYPRTTKLKYQNKSSSLPNVRDTKTADRKWIIANYRTYSRVPNKRAEGENNSGGWKWFGLTIIGGLKQLGGGVWRN